MPTIYKTVSLTQFQQLSQSVSDLQDQVNELDPEAVGLSLEIPTDLLDGIGVGKLGKFDNDGKLIVAVPDSGSTGAQAVAQLTIEASGSVASMEDVPATGYFILSPMLAPGDQVYVVTDEFGDWTFGFYNDEMDTPSEVEFVQFDSDLGQAAINLANAINAAISSDVATAQAIDETVQVIAGSEFEGQTTTPGLRIQSLSPSITTFDVGMMGELQNGDTVEVPGSRISIADYLYETPSEPSPDPLITFIEAGIHWTPDEDLEVEAANIAQAITTYFKNTEEKGWDATSLGSVVTMTRTIQGSLLDPPVNSISFSNWSQNPGINFANTGSYELPEITTGPFAGKILSVEEGVATISPKTIDEFTAAADIIAGEYLTGGAGGDLRPAGEDEQVYGMALNSVAMGQPVTVRQQGRN